MFELISFHFHFIKADNQMSKLGILLWFPCCRVLMFQFKRQATLANINIGKLSTAPSTGDMEFLMEQATKYRGRFVEISWTVAKTGVSFNLTTKVITGGQPVWMLYSNAKGDSELVWGHNSSDLTLMHNLVLLECEKSADNQISAAATDRLMDSGNASGSYAGQKVGAGPPGFQQPVPGVASSAGASAPQSAAQPAPHSAAQTGPQPTVGANPGHPPISHPALQHLAGRAEYAEQPVADAGGHPYAGAQQNPAAQSDPSVSQSMAAQNLPQNPLYSGGSGLGGESPAPQSAVQAPPQAPTAVQEPVQNAFQQNSAAAAPAGSGFPLEETPQLLEGNLSNVTVANLLKYIAQNTMTGRLALQGTLGSAEIYFANGAIQHAATLDTKGDSAVLDLMMCQSGDFQFHTGETTSQRSISLDLPTLLQNGSNLLEQNRCLQNAGLIPVSYLLKTKDGMTRDQFELVVSRGLPIDTNLQWKFFSCIDNCTTLANLLRNQPMVRAEWVPLIYNLIQLDLIDLGEEPSKAATMLIEPIKIDPATIDSLVKRISHTEDGILAYPVFAYFLQNEWYRYERSGGRFAVVIFSVESRNELTGQSTPLPPEIVAEAAKRIDANRRKLDMLCHFEGQTLALLLPETDSAGAAVFAHRIMQFLAKPVLSPALGDQTLSLHFGVASLPDDARDPGTLLAAARIAQNRAKMTGTPLVLYESFAT